MMFYSCTSHSSIYTVNFQSVSFTFDHNHAHHEAHQPPMPFRYWSDCRRSAEARYGVSFRASEAPNTLYLTQISKSPWHPRSRR